MATVTAYTAAQTDAQVAAAFTHPLRVRTQRMAAQFAAARMPATWTPQPGDSATSANVGGTIPAGGQFFDTGDPASPCRPPNGFFSGNNGSGVNWNAPWNTVPDMEMECIGAGCYVFVSVNDANMAYQWVIDGKPLTPAPITYGATGGVIITLTFGNSSSSSRHDVLFRSGGGQVAYVGRLSGGQIFAPIKRRHYVCIGDSLCSGATSNQTTMGNAVAEAIGILTGTPVYNASAGGTGYCANNSNAPSGPYGSSARLAGLSSLVDVDGIVVWGGANDVSWILGDTTGTNTVAKVKDAATALYAQLAVRMPNVPVVVMGVEPSPTITAGVTAGPVAAAVNAALRDAAAAAPNVVSFVDGLTDPWVTAANAGYIVMDDAVHWYREATIALTRKFLSEAFR
ncbi:SGNH/GDSL hydrolase family protein [Williamsia deligens]|uniref:SGNH/GDSL hydrolase family protein n=1 Tax=Williamsia deligens TaxID=321325 RepID=A0ABW3G1R6_9NOCA|nr:SGNH/GDSL hydrolase family protein [Williamsia deligens]MCP2195107.1 GDSL-like Lipase/Acylhydrolase family protein [Williamsia deligens]